MLRTVGETAGTTGARENLSSSVTAVTHCVRSERSPSGRRSIGARSSWAAYFSSMRMAELIHERSRLAEVIGRAPANRIADLPELIEARDSAELVALVDRAVGAHATVDTRSFVKSVGGESVNEQSADEKAVRSHCFRRSSAQAPEPAVDVANHARGPRSRGSRFAGTVDLTKRAERVISSDIGGGAVTDILIRDVPEDVIAAIDTKARRLGLSRTEYLRRTLTRERDVVPTAVSVADLAAFAETFADLADPEVIDRAWR